MPQHSQTGVFVLDNDEKSAKILVERLNSHGVLAKYSLDPQEALETCRQQKDRYGVLLSELHLKGTSGFDVAYELREERASAPEIILMSQDPKISLYECHQAGACYFLRKPVSFDELGLALRRFAKIEGLGGPSGTESPAALSQLYGQIRAVKQKNEIPIEVSNLGRGGFFARLNEGATAPSVGQVVDFHLNLKMVPSCQCQGRGIIRWKHESFALEESGVGIEFLKVPDWFQDLAVSFAELFRVKEYIPLQS